MTESSIEFLHVIHYRIGIVLSGLGFFSVHVGPLRDTWLTLNLTDRDNSGHPKEMLMICQLAAVKYNSCLSELKLHLTVEPH